MNQDEAIGALSALAQPTRLQVFRKLMSAGPLGLPAGAIAEAEKVPHNTMSTHLAILTRSGLVTSRRVGRSIIYMPDMDGTRALLSFLVADCCGGHPEVCQPIAKMAEAACCSPKQAKRTAPPRRAKVQT
jgi:DNA-binding transcriptional ArsR family regulator